MDFEKTLESFESESRCNSLVIRHLNQLKTLKCNNKDDIDCRFGLLRLLQAHESFVYFFYEKLLMKSKSSFHGYKLLGETTLVYSHHRIKGKILVLDADYVFNTFSENEMLISNLGGINAFFDSLVYTPMPFLFILEPILAEVADFIGIIFDNHSSSNSVCSGSVGSTLFVVLEPLTLQNIGLGFLCRNVIEDNRVSSLLCGFAYQKKQHKP